MQELNNKNKLFDLLAQGATGITPNNRLAAALLKQYAAQREESTLDKPECLPWNSLLLHRFEQFKSRQSEQSHPLIINEAQCQHAWRLMIQANPEMTYSEGLLQQVMEAWKHCQQWQIDAADPVFHYTPQTEQFQRWWQQFNTRLQSINAITEHQLVPFLLQNETPLFSKPVIWICFDEFTPQQTSLQHYLQQQNIVSYRYELNTSNAAPSVFAAKDSEEEYAQLIAWLKVKMAEKLPRIGVVVPDLQQKARALQRLLTRHFDPALINSSLGSPLSDFPLVAHALTWLQLDTEQLSHQEAALILQSPFLAGSQREFLSRSQYLQDSALLKQHNLTLPTLIQDMRMQAPELAACLNTLRAFPAQASVQEWIILMQDRLQALGFPGEYGLNSENYQYFNRFAALFDEFRQLGLISPVLKQHEALHALMHLAKNTIFQIQTPDAPIQISGLLEASGGEYNSLWVTGLTAQCLPKKINLSAFIPPQLQRDLSMPHSTPLREWHWARQTLERFERGADELVYSYAQLQEDQPHLPCALITDHAAFTPLITEKEPENRSVAERYEESYRVPLLAEERISGGTALLGNQAKCPFKAFAQHRLQAKARESAVDGLDSKEKGIVIHRVMELLWKTLCNQNNLLSLSAAALDKAIGAAINSALASVFQQNPDAMPALIQEIEHIRLKRLVLSCLEWEKQRPPFEVEALEQSYTIRLADLDFAVRVDRLDKTGDSKWVIDYKSRLPNSKPWHEDRPQEAQLLLYALLDEQINTLLLTELKHGKTLCTGFSEINHEIKGIQSIKEGESWKQYRDTWQQQLTQLAEEIRQGVCPPQPASPAICKHCDFQNLCRYRE